MAALSWKVVLARSRLHLVLVALIGLFLLSLLGFWLVEDVSFGDAFYWILIRLTTIGYGGGNPISWEGKMIGIFLKFGVVVLLVIAILLVARAYVDLKVETEVGKSLEAAAIKSPYRQDGGPPSLREE